MENEAADIRGYRDSGFWWLRDPDRNGFRNSGSHGTAFMLYCGKKKRKGNGDENVSHGEFALHKFVLYKSVLHKLVPGCSNFPNTGHSVYVLCCKFVRSREEEEAREMAYFRNSGRNTDPEDDRWKMWRNQYVK